MTRLLTGIPLPSDATMLVDRSEGKKRATGIQELAPEGSNIFKRGCLNRCSYCWSDAIAVWARGVKPAEWGVEILDEEKCASPIVPEGSSVIYPNTHDITPQHLPAHLTHIGKLLAAYPEVTIISKPCLESIKAICEAFPDHKDKLTFLFTFGTASDETRKKWEEHAPSIPERLECLKLAHSLGFKTSVINEPMLDNRPEEVIEMVKPYVTGVIWLGKAKLLMQRLSCNGFKDPETKARARQLLAWQSDANIKDLYERLKGDPMLRWKETIQKVVGLDGPIAR